MDADAARFGGGKSFGGKSSYSRSAPAPRTQQQAPNAQYANQRNQAVNPAGMPRPGLGGMLGGLLAGTLLGSLLFGGGHSGMGILDIALIALLGFMGLKLLRAFMNRRAGAAVQGAGGGESVIRGAPNADQWARMSNADASDSSSGAPAATGPDIRIEGFDQEDFLRGAKMLYARLQESWDKRDVDDIAEFTTSAIFNEVREQAEADPTPSNTEIILINADLVAAEREGDHDVVSVFFDVLLRETPNADTPSQARELWHFTRPAGSTESWKLDGIQQVS